MDAQPPPEADEEDDSRDVTGVSIGVMRRNGLAFVKGKGHIPDFPMRDLTGPEAAARIPNRAALRGVLATGIYAMIPDPPPPEPASDPPPTEPNRKARPVLAEPAADKES
jgi:hypothetical protein